MAHDIFVSYSTKDKPTADAACATLEAAGIRCWIAPRDILPGMEWGDAIIRAINDCRAMVLVFSSNANDSTQIRREVERAVSKGVPVIPLRIEDIAPTHSLEYFIGTVHWLDALTPPLESHLQRLSENVAALLNTGINPHKNPDSHAPPIIVPPRAPQSSPASASVGRSNAVSVAPWLITAAAGAVVLVGGLLWWHSDHASSSTSPSALVDGGLAASVDPVFVGNLDYSAVIDDYDWHFSNQIGADGTYKMVVTQEEFGTYQLANGQYQTTASKTHRVRQGTYVMLSANTMQVSNTGGTVVYRLQQPNSGAAGNATPSVWQGNVVVNGQPWVLTMQTNPDGSYHFTARADDHGTFRAGNGVWQSTSAVTGQTTPGTYQALSSHEVRVSAANGSGVWQRS